MARDLVIDVHDWHVAVEGVTLTARPSAGTVLRQLWLTAIAAVLIGMLAFTLGFPPGSKRIGRQQQRIASRERVVLDLQKQADRLRSSVTFNDPQSVARTRYDQLLAECGQRQAELEQQRQKLAVMKPSLGPVGDAAYWLAVALLVLIGAGVPLICPLARVRLTYDGPPGHGTLTVRCFDRLPLRTVRLDTAAVGAIDLFVRRLITHHRKTGQINDHGWLWSVTLDSEDDSSNTTLILLADRENMLSPHMTVTTPRVQMIVRYLEAVTALEANPPVETDVIDIQRGFLGVRTTLRHRVRQSPPSPS